jgi:hypothetical protein
MTLCVAIEDALWTTTTRKIPETFPALNRISILKNGTSAVHEREKN